MSNIMQEDFKKKVLDGYYNDHPQGDVLLELDMETVITEAIIENEIQNDISDYEKENSKTLVPKQ